MSSTMKLQKLREQKFIINMLWLQDIEIGRLQDAPTLISLYHLLPYITQHSNSGGILHFATTFYLLPFTSYLLPFTLNCLRVIQILIKCLFHVPECEE